LKKLFRILGISAATSFIVAAGFLFFDFSQNQDRFPPRTYVGQINVSGLKRAEALAKISSYSVSDAFTPIITFEVENLYYRLSPEAVGIRINYDESINQAFDKTHNSNYLKELKNRLTTGLVHCPLILNVDETVLTGIVAAIAQQVRSTSRDATITLYERSGGYHVEQEELGREINVESAVNTFKEKIKNGATTFQIIVTYEKPKITEKDLRTSPPINLLASYTTYYGKHDSPNRIHNIRLIASWLDGMVLMPNDKVSLADSIGDFTPERGFKEAYVIYNGALVPQLGGGTCQIGTTLYNALAAADIKINARQNHSFYFNIYPLGRDATVYPGQKDLVFQNDTGYPIMIKTTATNRRLSFRIYGTPSGKKIVFSYPSVYILTESGYRPATVRQVLAADAPFRTTVVRTVYNKEGIKIKSEIIRSYYKLYGEKSNVPIIRPESR